MLRRLLITGFIALIIVISAKMPSLASPSNYQMYSKNVSSTSDFLITITRPERNETCFKKFYVICGNTSKQDIRIKLLMYNSALNTYQDYENTDGESSWDIGRSGVFIKEIELPKQGVNKFRVVAYNKYDKNLEIGENLQVSNFTINLLNKSIKEVIRSNFFKMTDMLSQLFDD